jgi:hypothetical protein
MDMEHIKPSTMSTFRGILYSPPHLCPLLTGTAVLMLSYSNFTAAGTWYVHRKDPKHSMGCLQARARLCVCACVCVSICVSVSLLLPNGGPSGADGDTMQVVQPSRVLVWSYVSVICACGCRVAPCCRECCKPVLNVTRATVQLVYTTEMLRFAKWTR